MNKLYIFAIGGSGSRVLKSLTMLLAAGIKLNYDIVPMIVDPDNSNGDMIRTINAIRKYQSIHGNLDFNNTVKNTFFSTNISALNDDTNFQLPLVGTSGITFEKYMNLATMSTENQAIIRMLFSNKNLSSDMNVGFKGNPNIGSVVLNQFTESENFASFATKFVSGDKVFIISSIFGGTGASGFPLLLKSIRTNNNSALSSAPVGAVSLLPYFNLKDDSESSISADSFITKAKAALNYYENNVTGNGTLDDMYYLGDDYSSSGYDNCDGGDMQQNNAHIIELLAATAIIDFAQKNKERSNSTDFHEFGLASDTKGKVIFTDFGNWTKNLLLKPLAQMAIMNSYLNKRDIKHRTSQKWAIDRKGLLGETFFASQEFNTYTSFKSMFEEWLKEMADNSLGFKPFADDEDVADAFGKVQGYQPRYSKLPWKKKGYDLMDETMSEMLSSVQKNASAFQTFLELFFMTTDELCKSKLNF